MCVYPDCGAPARNGSRRKCARRRQSQNLLGKAPPPAVAVTLPRVCAAKVPARRPQCGDDGRPCKRFCVCPSCEVGCKRGGDGHYAHSNATCSFFQEGRCEWGSKCRFSHDVQNARTPEATEDARIGPPPWKSHSAASSAPWRRWAGGRGACFPNLGGEVEPQMSEPLEAARETCERGSADGGREASAQGDSPESLSGEPLACPPMAALDAAQARERPCSDGAPIEATAEARKAALERPLRRESAPWPKALPSAPLPALGRGDLTELDRLASLEPEALAPQGLDATTLLDAMLVGVAPQGPRADATTLLDAMLDGVDVAGTVPVGSAHAELSEAFRAVSGPCPDEASRPGAPWGGAELVPPTAEREVRCGALGARLLVRPPGRACAPKRTETPRRSEAPAQAARRLSAHRAGAPPGRAQGAFKELGASEPLFLGEGLPRAIPAPKASMPPLATSQIAPRAPPMPRAQASAHEGAATTAPRPACSSTSTAARPAQSQLQLAAASLGERLDGEARRLAAQRKSGASALAGQSHRGGHDMPWFESWLDGRRFTPPLGVEPSSSQSAPGA